MRVTGGQGAPEQSSQPAWQRTLQEAHAHAQNQRYDDCLTACRRILNDPAHELDALLGAGTLLMNFGLLGEARRCFERARESSPSEPGPLANLANLAREAGDHRTCRQLYTGLLERFPDHPVIRRNALTSFEYDPEVQDAVRLAQAQAWGRWAMDRTGGARLRPAFGAPAKRPLRIGYVSADFCHHTVGLFVTGVLAAHDPEWVSVYAYSAGKVHDGVTAAIRRATVFHDVSGLDDAALAQRIRADAIDVLVDLSGHTAGSRLIAFAYRPAPVQVSWLGYWATTGLPALDAVLLDDWSAPDCGAASFTEKIIRLPGGRFCYAPVLFAPAVSPAPCVARGCVTFGCFNNTAKLNPRVLELWARLLHAAPGSRLLLKWRTFLDAELRRQVLRTFDSRGVNADRIELRPASFHADVLKQYADVDIALDPFPFNGGQTSCEALWMGVPVVTWPQSRVVSRQTFAYLSAIGCPQWSAASAGEYVNIAAGLASDPAGLQRIRAGLRAKMSVSSLCDVRGFTRGLEQAYAILYEQFAGKPAPTNLAHE